MKLDELNARPVEGGHEGDGTPLFIAQAHVNNAIVPGKCSSKLKRAFLPYGGDEKEKEVRISSLPIIMVCTKLVRSTTASCAGLEALIGESAHSAVYGSTTDLCAIIVNLRT